MKNGASILGLFLGILVTPIALLFAVASAGGGHGHYLEAKMLFPITMLSSIVFGSITPPFIVLAIAQFPLYGWLLGMGLRSDTPRATLWLPILIHCGAIALNFLIPNPNFS